MNCEMPCNFNNRCIDSAETGVYEKLVRRQLNKVTNIIDADAEELEAADTIDALLDGTADGKP
jgi:hypothetical protein